MVSTVAALVATIATLVSAVATLAPSVASTLLPVAALASAIAASAATTVATTTVAASVESTTVARSAATESVRSHGVVFSELCKSLCLADLEVDPSLVSEVVEDVLESCDVLFCDIEDSSSLVLEHAHSSDVAVDIFSEELSHDAPDVRNCHEFLFKLNLVCNAVLLASQEGS